MLDLLFEPSPPLQALTLPVLRSTTFPSYDVLIIAVGAQLTALAASNESEDVVKLSEILCAHPRLGEKKVESEQSRKEQAQLQSGGEEEKEVSNTSRNVDMLMIGKLTRAIDVGQVEWGI
jgi:hypothetical protein